MSSFKLITLGLAMAGAVSATPFSPGNIAVLRVGTGGTVLNNAATAVFVDEYSPAGVLVQSIAIPSSGVDALVLAGVGVTEGSLIRSPDGSQITFAGYNTAAGTANVAGTPAATVPRAVAKVDVAGNYVQVGKTSAAFSSMAVRAAATDGAGNYWAAGTIGTYYYGLNGAPAVIQSTLGGRAMGVFNGKLYFSNPGGTKGLYGFSGAPTTATPAASVFKTGATSAPAGFAIDPTGTVVYLADETSGVQKWAFNGTDWVLAYTMNGIAGVRGLTVDFSDPTPLLYAVTTEASANRIVRCEDLGPGSSFQVVVTAEANTVIRGAALAPSSVSPAIYVQPEDTVVNCGATSAIKVWATALSPVAYQWHSATTGLLAEQTNHTLSLANVTTVAEDSYFVVVSEGGRSVTSRAAKLTVAYPAIVPGLDRLGGKAGGSVQVPLGKLMANDRVADGSPLTFLALGPALYGHAAYDAVSGLVTYTAPSTFRDTDFFMYQVASPCGGLTNITVTVSMAPEAPSANIVIGPVVTPRNTIYTRFAGIPGKTYRIESATQPSGPWAQVGVRLAARNGLFVYEESFTPPVPATPFYRAVP